MKLTFLGTGTSFGVPQLGCHCAVCHSNDLRDKRTRVGAVVESDAGTRLLLDTPPELRLQLLSAGIEQVDAILYTHDHADHLHGIDDIRAFSVRRSSALPVYGPSDALAEVAKRFAYIFDERVRPLPGTSKPEAKAHAVEAGRPFSVAEMEITPVQVPHGSATVFGYRMGPLAYVTDAKSLPPATVEILRGAKVLVLNALFRTEHPTHLSISEALAAAAEVGAERTYLTHLTHHNFHADLEREMPNGIAPAYDGLTVQID